jgi:Type IV secretion-system coupling protein DNA-binding domain
MMTFSLLGIDTQTGERVSISQSARREGVYLIGAPGQGKTGLIENLIVQVIEQGLGVAVLDQQSGRWKSFFYQPKTALVDQFEQKKIEPLRLYPLKLARHIQQ